MLALFDESRSGMRNVVAEALPALLAIREIATVGPTISRWPSYLVDLPFSEAPVVRVDGRD